MPIPKNSSRRSTRSARTKRTKKVKVKSPNKSLDVGSTPQKKRALTDSLKVAATYSPTICSTIGVAELNDPVRNGKGWDLSAITT